MLERGPDERLGKSICLLCRAGSLNEHKTTLFDLVTQESIANTNVFGTSLKVKIRRSQELDDSLVVFENVNWLLRKAKLS